MRTRSLFVLVVLGSAALSAALGAQWKPDWQRIVMRASATHE